MRTFLKWLLRVVIGVVGLVVILFGVLVYQAITDPPHKETAVKTEKTVKKEEPKSTMTQEEYNRIVEQNNIASSLRNFKTGYVSKWEDFRSTTGTFTVFYTVSNKSDAGSAVQEAKNFVNQLNTKPKQVIVIVQYNGAKVFQFHMDGQTMNYTIDEDHILK